MYFPLELPLGRHIPLYGSIPGRSFRLRRHPETTSQSERGFRDVLFRLGCHRESASHSASLRRFLYARALRRVRFSAVGGIR